MGYPDFLSEAESKWILRSLISIRGRMKFVRERDSS